VKAILNIGGEGVGESFPTISINSVLRPKFIANFTTYAIEHQIDVIEIDWEYWLTPEKVDTMLSFCYSVI
tara:strand:+ start:468 stop:677 length:210 start_codon:yes stop_codon:yes gene_type:complete